MGLPKLIKGLFFMRRKGLQRALCEGLPGFWWVLFRKDLYGVANVLFFGCDSVVEGAFPLRIGMLLVGAKSNIMAIGS